MDGSRRGFLKSSALFTTAALCGRDVFAQDSVNAEVFPGTLPILQGMTDAHSTSLIILHPQQEPLFLRVTAASGAPIPVHAVDSSLVAGTDQVLSEFFVDQLVPACDHRLEVLNGDGQVVDRRVFRSRSLLTNGTRFAVVSCMHDFFKNISSMWETLVRENPDFVVFLGDTVYCDGVTGASTEAKLGQRYAESRMKLPWFRSERLFPSYATWDDHDFGANNADKTFSMGEVTRGLFRRFWGDSFRGEFHRGYGVGSMFEAGGQRFFLLDDRSFRDVARTGGRHWGDDQSEWLFSLLERDSRPAWLMNGSQFFGGYVSVDAFESCHREDLQRVMQRLSRIEAPVSLVSGDVHFSEIMGLDPAMLGYTAYEYTSSSMHSFTFPYHQHRVRNPLRLMSEWHHNFLMIETSVGPAGWQIRTRCVRDKGVLGFQHDALVRRDA